jgi:hypothetical protein
MKDRPTYRTHTTIVVRGCFRYLALRNHRNVAGVGRSNSKERATSRTFMRATPGSLDTALLTAGTAPVRDRWVRRIARKIAGPLAAALAIFLTLAVPGHADDQMLPIPLEAELFVKVLAYDKNFPDRAGDTARIFLVAKPGHLDSARVASQMQTALRAKSNIVGLAHEEEVVSFEGAAKLGADIKRRGIDAIFLGPGFDDDVDDIRTALDGQDVLTAGSVPEYVPRGIVLGFDIVSGSPKVLVHLTQAKRQNVALRAELLHIARLFE